MELLLNRINSNENRKLRNRNQRGIIIPSKDKDLIERMVNFFQDVNKFLQPLGDKHKPTNPFDIVENVLESVNKVIDGVTIGFENLPPYMAKILEINRDAQRAFNERRYSDYIMHKYKGAEIFYKEFYQEIFKKDLNAEDKINLSEIIIQIEKKLNMNSGILDKLNYWRGVRNQIVHEHLKVDRKKAEKAKRFFDKLYKSFKKYLKIVN